jgi:hypothetical protein
VRALRVSFEITAERKRLAMKKPPVKGDRVYFYNTEGERISRTVLEVNPSGFVSTEETTHSIHYKFYQGKLSPKKKLETHVMLCQWAYDGKYKVFYPYGDVKKTIKKFLDKRTRVIIEVLDES